MLASPLASPGVTIRSHWVKMECHQTVNIINKISKLIPCLPDKINLTDNETLLDQWTSGPATARLQTVNLITIQAAGFQRQTIQLNLLIQFESKLLLRNLSQLDGGGVVGWW